MADFKVGDRVGVVGMAAPNLGRSGRISGILDASERIKNTHRVTFDDGEWCFYGPNELAAIEEAGAGAKGYAATGKESETIVTDEATGGAKAEKLAQLGSLDPQALYTLAEVAGMGASKYSRFNFLRGYRWSLSIDAAFRHFLKFLMGEDLDPESGLPHVAHAAWHMLCLLSFQQRGLGTDDRFKQEGH